MRHVAGSSGRSDSLPVEELTTSVPSLPVAFAPLGLKYLEEHELRRSFDAYDTNGNGLINAHEARAMLRDAGAEGSLECAEQAVAAFDSQGRGAISFEELKAAVDVAATPVDGRVLFAGEATTYEPFWAASAHGAFHSGLREAKRLGITDFGIPGIY